MPNLAKYLPNNLSFKVGDLLFTPSLLEVGFIVFLLFLLVLMLAQVRHHLLGWAFKGIFPGIFIGILIAFIMEGFLIVGGKTVVTEVLGWKNPPKPIASVLEAGKLKLVQVLGTSSQIPASNIQEKASVQKVIESFQSLNPSDSKKARSLICVP